MKKLVLWSAAAALLYLFMFLLIPKSEDAPDMYSTNVLKAQTYMSQRDNCELVVVGSSMAAELNLPDDDDSCCNLAFFGGCSLTGLKLIVEKGRLYGLYPDTVIVEMNNTIENGTDDDIIKKTSGFDYLLINRIENRPDYLFYSLIKSLRNKKEKSLYDAPVIKERIDYWTEARSVETDQDLLNAKMDEALNYCRLLKQNGVRIVIMEPPNDASLYDLPQTRQVRETALKFFPEAEYEWFTVDWNDYVVSDGLHMGNLSSRKYSDLLLQRYKPGVAAQP